MDVHQETFRKQLLSILKNIANANFITFDLEMSGITTRPRHCSGDHSHDIGKPNLQQQYEEMKTAAETFQILQMGITCVEEDREKEYYLARPYNFNLSPLSAESVDLRLERVFSFSSSACEFLSKNRFDFGKVFSSGVPYLSREEEDELRDEYNQRADKNSKIPDIIIAAHDSATLDFYRGARRTISAWTKNVKPELDFVNIGNPTGPLNGFQRRLIHQLVRNEFPNLRVFARNDCSFMQVTNLDVKKEAEFQIKKLLDFNHKIAKQKGLRWIFEALAGGDLSGIDPEWFCNKNSDKPEEQLPAITEELKQVIESLREKTHVIVGHNLFTDLGFIYKTFIGTLPNSVKHFQEDIHELFPIIIDTKYLATHRNDSMNPRANLKELLTPFRKIQVPLIVLHEEHTTYGATYGKEHEAGFDSWMTAELFVKLTAKLSTTHAHLSGSSTPTSIEIAYSTTSSPEDSDSASGDGGAPISPPSTFTNGQNHTSFSQASSADNLPRAWHTKQLNRFAVLQKDNNEEAEAAAEEPKPRQWIPGRRNAFWGVYANKLRVNAIEGGVCDLEGAED